MLPPVNSLPTSYEATLSAIEPYLVHPVIYDVCQNDCVVFRCQHASLLECPKCGSGRYLPEQSKLAVRMFMYLPLKPRLHTLFENHNIAQVLLSHCTVRDDDNSIFDIHQSVFWKTAYSTTGLFQGDHRGISLVLCTDGVNLFAHNKVSYSI